MIPGPGDDVTRLLGELSAGRTEAFHELLPLVHSELRRRAASYLRRERPNHTLQPTALVNEAFLKLVEQRDVRWQNRVHFFAVASQAMRRILVDHARTHQRVKRGGNATQVALDDAMIATESRSIDLLALDEALERLAALDERQARVVEMRFFGGLTVEETAAVLDISPATIKREWSMAKAWLHTALSAKPPGAPE
ncbi:MAG: sigma-70 family RNA polymerase sigma factor [Vicinamibacterales bacterium]